MPTADRTCASVLERGNGWVLAMLVPPAEAGGPARGCAPAALSRGAVAPLCAPWLSGGVGARSAPTNRRARSPRGVEQGAAFWCSRLKNVRVRLAARSLHRPIDLPRAVHISGFDRLAAKSETTAVGLANPPTVRRKRNSFFVRGIRILEGASCSKRRRD